MVPFKSCVILSDLTARQLSSGGAGGQDGSHELIMIARRVRLQDDGDTRVMAFLRNTGSQLAPIDDQHAAGKLAAKCLRDMGALVKEGNTPLQIDQACREWSAKRSGSFNTKEAGTVVI